MALARLQLLIPQLCITSSPVATSARCSQWQKEVVYVFASDRIE
jgi:hypothetical protein